MSTNKKQTEYRFIGLSALAALIISCGGTAKAPKQEIIAPEIPSYPAIDNHIFSLTPASSSIGYGGTMLLFNEAAEIQDIANVLQISIDSRRAWAESKKFEVESNYKKFFTEKGVIAEAISDMKTELRSFESAARAENPLTVDQKRENTSVWFNQTLEKAYGAEDNQEKSAAKFVWGQYCDAKVIELATNSYIASSSFTSRPTPMAFCENYYADKGYFSGETCNKNPAGQSYFSCLWNEGVLKTWWFKNIYLSDTPVVEVNEGVKEKVSDLSSETNMPILQAILALDENYIDVSKGPLRKRIFGPDGKLKTYFSDLFLKQVDQGKICSMALPELTDICSLFAVNWPAGIISNLKNESEFQLTPFETINLLEGTDTSLNGYFEFPENTIQGDVSLKDIIAYIGQRINHSPSESDRIFNAEAKSFISVEAVFSDNILAKASQIQDILADTIYGKLSPSSEKIANEKKQKIAELAQYFNDAVATNDRLQAEITKTTDQGFTIGNTTGLAHAFIEARLKISNHDGIVRSYFWVKDHEDYAVLGCFNVQLSFTLLGKQCSPDPRDGIKATNFQKADLLTIDQESGRLDLTINIVDAVGMGLGPKARVTDPTLKADSFMDLDPEIIEGKSLVFELFPNRIYDHLEILTGKAFIKDGPLDLYEAGVSFWDQNL